MGAKKPKSRKSQHRISEEKLTTGLHKSLEGKYGKILAAARRKWEREFGPAKEPSDARINVRIARAPKKGGLAPRRRKPPK